MTDRPRRVAFHRSQLFWQYVLLAVLFTRTMWDVWEVRDLTTGDTSSYYTTAFDFAHGLVCNIAWSPLYTSFFGAFHWLNPDPYFVVLAHRLAIVAILSVLIFEVSRRLLDPVIAWFVTAWWMVLPINFNALYEVHLFAIIPILVFWLLLAGRPSIRMRAAAAGVLLLTTILVRNELLVAVCMFGFLSVCFDLWQWWRRKSELRPLRFIAAYGVPLAIAIGISAVFYARSTDKFPELSNTFAFKHTLNVSQIYAFGYGQRHPEEPVNPWTSEGDRKLMERDFGKAFPTMREAFFINPRAMRDHFLWNVYLIPAGLQVSLFNVRSGDQNPDYAATKQNVPVALTLSALYLVIVAAGLILFVKNFREWRGWLADRGWILVGIIAVCSTVVIVMIMQRPRPSYMFAQTLAMMWLGGFSLQIILHYLPFRAITGRRIGVAAMVAIALLVPPYYLQAKAQLTKRKNPPKSQKASARLEALRREAPRPLLQMLRLVEPYKPWLVEHQGQIAVPGYMFELNSYLGIRTESSAARTFDLAGAVQGLNGASLDDALKKANVAIIILSGAQEKTQAGVEFIRNAPSLGWKQVVEPAPPNLRMWMFVRADVPVTAR